MECMTVYEYAYFEWLVFGVVRLENNLVLLFVQIEIFFL